MRYTLWRIAPDSGGICKGISVFGALKLISATPSWGGKLPLCRELTCACVRWQLAPTPAHRREGAAVEHATAAAVADGWNGFERDIAPCTLERGRLFRQDLHDHDDASDRGLRQ